MIMWFIFSSRRYHIVCKSTLNILIFPFQTNVLKYRCLRMSHNVNTHVYISKNNTDTNKNQAKFITCTLQCPTTESGKSNVHAHDLLDALFVL